MSASIFGFPEKASSEGGDFAAIIKYDARAGRLFRVDRGQDSAGAYHSTPVDITHNFKAICDFDNLETGWMLFQPGQAPSMHLVRMGKQLLPPLTDQYKRGVRFMLRLANECAGSVPVREVAGTARTFLDGVGAAYAQYLADKDKNQGKLPVLILESTTPVTTGTGQRTSTNYQPNFRLIGWAPRGDLVFVPKAPQDQALPQGFTNGAAPQTGGARVEPPKQQTVSASDFG